MWIERLEAAPAVLVGQSLGGHTAFLVAARRPDVVSALVVVEATPAAANPAARDGVRRWLESWPRPFSSAAHATEFFGGDSVWSRAWLRGLERRGGGLWPRFEIDVMMASLQETAEESYWDEWRRVSCPTLIVRGERGVCHDEVTQMQELVPTAQVAEIPHAGHDAHLDALDEWLACLVEFLGTLDG
jgi:pimeloyl-ACP methyl ester carboxylesterase